MENQNTSEGDLLWCIIIPFIAIPVALTMIFIETNCFNIPSFIDKLIDELLGHK